MGQRAGWVCGSVDGPVREWAGRRIGELADGRAGEPDMRIRGRTGGHTRGRLYTQARGRAGNVWVGGHVWKGRTGARAGGWRERADGRMGGESGRTARAGGESGRVERASGRKDLLPMQLYRQHFICILSMSIQLQGLTAELLVCLCRCPTVCHPFRVTASLSLMSVDRRVCLYQDLS